jgi:hypothetical protein
LDEILLQERHMARPDLWHAAALLALRPDRVARMARSYTRCLLQERPWPRSL